MLDASSPSRHLAESRSHVRIRFVCVGQTSALQDPKTTIFSAILCSPEWIPRKCWSFLRQRVLLLLLCSLSRSISAFKMRWVVYHESSRCYIFGLSLCQSFIVKQLSHNGLITNSQTDFRKSRSSQPGMADRV